MINEEEYMNLQEILKNSFQDVQDRFDTIEQTLDDFKIETNNRLDYHETWLNRIENNMATKSQLNGLCLILKKKISLSDYEMTHVMQDVRV